MIRYQFVRMPPRGLRGIRREDLTELENRFHFLFPVSLKDYYLLFNGCEITPCMLSVNGKEYRVDEMIPVLRGAIHLEEAINIQIESEVLPGSLIPFARNKLCGIFYWERSGGGVYFSFYDDPHAIEPICGSVDTFFEMMNQAQEAG